MGNFTFGNDFLSPVFLLFGRKLAKTPPFPTNEQIVKFNTVTNEWELSSDAGVGQANTSSNVGTGAGLALPKVGVDLPFKSIIVTAPLSITVNPTDITLAQKLEKAIAIFVDNIFVLFTVPATLQEFPDGSQASRTQLDLTNFNQARFFINQDFEDVPAGAIMFLQYDSGSGFATLAVTASQGEIDIADGVGLPKIKETGFFNIASASKALSKLRVVSDNGGGGEEIELSTVGVEFRA